MGQRAECVHCSTNRDRADDLPACLPLAAPQPDRPDRPRAAHRRRAVAAAPEAGRGGGRRGRARTGRVLHRQHPRRHGRSLPAHTPVPDHGRAHRVARRQGRRPCPQGPAADEALERRPAGAADAGHRTARNDAPARGRGLHRGRGLRQGSAATVRIARAGVCLRLARRGCPRRGRHPPRRLPDRAGRCGVVPGPRRGHPGGAGPQCTSTRPSTAVSQRSSARWASIRRPRRRAYQPRQPST